MSKKLNAKEVTRSTLERALNDPMFLLFMAADGVTSGDIEFVVKDILEYLEKTKKEEKLI